MERVGGEVAGKIAVRRVVRRPVAEELSRGHERRQHTDGRGKGARPRPHLDGPRLHRRSHSVGDENGDRHAHGKVVPVERAKVVRGNVEIQHGGGHLQEQRASERQRQASVLSPQRYEATHGGDRREDTEDSRRTRPMQEVGAEDAKQIGDLDGPEGRVAWQELDEESPAALLERHVLPEA